MVFFKSFNYLDRIIIFIRGKSLKEDGIWSECALVREILVEQ